jgi:hypothetical protein
VFSDGLSCFTAVKEAECTHRPTVIGARKPKDLPEFKWINTVLGNLKTSLSGSYHAFAFRKYAGPYLAAFAYRFNRRGRSQHATYAPDRRNRQLWAAYPTEYSVG